MEHFLTHCGPMTESWLSQLSGPPASRDLKCSLWRNSAETLELVRTQASRQLLVPLGARGASVEAGQQAVPRQSEALVADVLDGGTHGEMGPRQHPPAVLHLSGVGARHHWMDRHKEKV